MRPFRRCCMILASSGVLALSISGVAAADPGSGCTIGGDPPGQFISFVAQTFGQSGTLNPGNAHSSFAPFVPGVNGCNPTGNPTPPSR
jgi:hypothetical protein